MKINEESNQADSQVFLRDANGFTLIEILIAMLIISLSIMCFSAAFRQIALWHGKQDGYKEVYIASQSLINQIVSSEQTGAEENESEAGAFNGFEYKYNCETHKVLKNYIFSPEVEALSGNSGRYEVVLQKCELVLTKALIPKTFSFYRTQYIEPDSAPPVI